MYIHRFPHIHAYRLIDIFSSCSFRPPLPHLRPGQTERRLHNAVVRHGLGLDCNLEYRAIPICTGHDEEDRPIIELVEWPFILPHTFATCLCFDIS